MKRSVLVGLNEAGCIYLKIKLFERQKERDTRRRVSLKKLTVADLLNDIPQFTGTSLCIPRFTTDQAMHREV
jgi:hypothetical protein